MKVKKIPLRTCVVTKEKQEKKNLLRIVRTPEGKVIVDFTGKSNGRGAYITKDLNVLEKAKKTKVLDKHLEIEVPSSIYEEIENIINND